MSDDVLHQAVAYILEFHEAMVRADYRRAIHLAAAMDLDGPAVMDRTDLLTSLVDAVFGLRDGSDDELLAYNLIVRIGGALERDNQASERVHAEVARALSNKAAILAERGPQGGAAGP